MGRYDVTMHNLIWAEIMLVFVTMHTLIWADTIYNAYFDMGRYDVTIHTINVAEILNI